MIFLRRGGRGGTFSAFAGTLLGIKPILHVDETGHLIPMSKVRGRRQSLEALADKMMHESVSHDQIVFISHADALQSAEELAQILKTRVGIKDVLIGNIGTVIGSHSGPGTIAMFYMGDNR